MHVPFDFTINVPTILSGAAILWGVGKRIALKVNGLIDTVDSIKTTQLTVTALEARIKTLEGIIHELQIPRSK